MYKPSVTAEAARDIAAHMLDTNQFTYHNVIVVDDPASERGPALRFYFLKVGYDEGTFGELEIPIVNLLEMLKFSLTTISASHELIQP